MMRSDNVVDVWANGRCIKEAKGDIVPIFLTILRADAKSDQIALLILKIKRGEWKLLDSIELIEYRRAFPSLFLFKFDDVTNDDLFLTGEEVEEPEVHVGVTDCLYTDYDCDSDDDSEYVANLAITDVVPPTVELEKTLCVFGTERHGIVEFVDARIFGGYAYVEKLFLTIHRKYYGRNLNIQVDFKSCVISSHTREFWDYDWSLSYTEGSKFCAFNAGAIHIYFSDMTTAYHLIHKFLCYESFQLACHHIKYHCDEMVDYEQGNFVDFFYTGLEGRFKLLLRSDSILRYSRILLGQMGGIKESLRQALLKEAMVAVQKNVYSTTDEGVLISIAKVLFKYRHQMSIQYNSHIEDPGQINKRCEKRYNLIKLVGEPEEKVHSYLDFGCGDGEVTVYIKKKLGAVYCYGYDPNVKENPRYIHFDHKSQLDSINQGSVDVVTAFMSLHHAHNHTRVLRTFRNLLKMGGHLYVYDHDVANKIDQAVVELQHMNYRHVWRQEMYRNEYLWCRSVTRWDDLIQSYGFEKVSIQRVNKMESFIAHYVKKKENVCFVQTFFADGWTKFTDSNSFMASALRIVEDMGMAYGDLDEEYKEIVREMVNSGYLRCGSDHEKITLTSDFKAARAASFDQYLKLKKARKNYKKRLRANLEAEVYMNHDHVVDMNGP